MKKNSLLKLLVLLLGLSLANCVEPYQLQSNTFEEALVIEASITNEMKQQEIKISRTYKLEEDGPAMETGAQVTVTDDAGNTYGFDEADDKYVSAAPFQAVPGRQYQLSVLTADGKSYTSATETLTAVNSIENVTASVATNQEGIRGVQISVNSFDPTGNSKYYQYEYEETNKIIAPYWYPDKVIRLNEDNNDDGLLDLVVLPRDAEARTCFTTKKSDQILLTSTMGLSEDRVVDFPLRFIADDDYTIAVRYSILVRQHVQNLASYTFYKTLREMSGSGSILSQNQPGFFYGNLRAAENPDEKVIGFFEVSSVSEKRIFFNYADLFPGEDFPDYLYPCFFRNFNITDLSNGPEGYLVLSGLVASNSLILYLIGYPTYFMVTPECGDCTNFSSNIVPPFWED